MALSNHKKKLRMATKQPTSQRLKVEQYVICIERATIILFFIWFFAIEYLINHKTFSETMVFLTISICFLVILHSLEQSESEILENINFRLGIRRAEDEYADLHQRSNGSYKCLFWFERLAISSFFIMFIKVETSALTIGVAAATAGVIFCCNMMYLHCFLESESEEQQEFGKEEEEEEYYEMKLKRKKDKWERKLKEIRDVYREDHSKWEEDNRNLAAKLLTATATSELYRALMRDLQVSHI